MSLFTFVKSQLSILSVISEFAALKKSGIYWKGQCPFHHEKTPSFTVSPHKEIFYCFGCHVGGDVISFIEKIEHCSSLEAARFLIDRYKLSVPAEFEKDIHHSKTDTKHYHAICDALTSWLHDHLLNTKSALAYLQKRGFSLQTIKKYRVGYFPGGLAQLHSLIDSMAKQNILVEDLTQIHFISRGKKVFFSGFEERIMFPIMDHLGRVCGFGGRVFKPDDTRPKYYNSHENEFFSKGNLLFGLSLAKKIIQEKGSVFLVEGYTDCLALYQAGFLNVVATLGTACTSDHLRQLSRYAQVIYILYDGDRAGIQAILRIAQLCWDVNLDLQVIPMLQGQDPASFLEQKGDLNVLISQAQNIFSFAIAKMGADFENTGLSGKMEISRKIVDLIQAIPDVLKRDILLAEAAKSLKLPLKTLVKEIKASPGSEISLSAPEEESKKNALLGILEKKIICAILNNTQLLNPENEGLLSTHLPEPYNEIIKTLGHEKGSDYSISFNQLFSMLDEIKKNQVSKLLLEHQEEISIQEFDQLMIQLQKKHWKFMVNDIKTKLENAKLRGNEQEVAQLVQDFIALKKKVIEKVS